MTTYKGFLYYTNLTTVRSPSGSSKLKIQNKFKILFHAKIHELISIAQLLAPHYNSFINPENNLMRSSSAIAAVLIISSIFIGLRLSGSHSSVITEIAAQGKLI